MTDARPTIHVTDDAKRRKRICDCYAACRSSYVVGLRFGMCREAVRLIVKEDRPDLLQRGKNRRSGGDAA